MDSLEANWRAADLGSSEDELDYLEIPCFLESLASSASQLRELAEKSSNYYIKGLISYGYIHESKGKSKESDLPEVAAKPATYVGHRSNGAKLANCGQFVSNSNNLESISSLVDVLPFLNDLSGHIGKCFTTLELTFRRFNYHLNKSSSAANKQHQPIRDSNEFRPPPESRFDAIFVSIMDLLFAFLSLDETIKSHTDIRHSISLLKQACQMENNEDTVAERDKLERLLEFVRNIESTICDENRSIFRQCLEHLQHLDLILHNRGKLQQAGARNISEHLDDFIVSYAQNLMSKSSELNTGSKSNLKSSLDVTLNLLQSNMLSTPIMTSVEQKILGLSSLFILNSWIFKKPDKKSTKAFNQMLMKFKQINLINLAQSNIFLTLLDFLQRYLPNFKSCVENKTFNHLKGQDEQLLALDLMHYFKDATLEFISWQIKLKAILREHPPEDDHRVAPSANVSVPEWQTLLETGLNLMEEINTLVRTIIAVHLKYKRPIKRNNLVLLLKSVALLKSIHLALVENQTSVLRQQLLRDRILRFRWRKLMSAARKRQITKSRYSDRKLDSGTSLILFGLCSNLIDRLATDQGRSLLSMAVSMLSSACFNEQELRDLNELLTLVRPDVYQTLGCGSNCAYLYWDVTSFSAYYNHVFEEDPGNVGEISYFHRAVDDIRLLFSFDESRFSADGTLDWLVERRNQFIERLAIELMDQFKLHTLDKICQELEIELRLQTHRDLHLDGHNPFRRHLYNFKRIFSQPDARRLFSIFGRTISLKQHVEQHLSENYYNLISLAPHDWFTYDCMINLARHKYGLQLINSQMPTQTIDCGVDLMDITRNLALFVSRYTYDMSNQLFIEKCSNRVSTSSAASLISGHQTATAHSMLNLNNIAANQLLNVIQIRHVSMSIQNHGFGLLNSAINCTYQLMKRLISLIARQTSEDQLRAVLAKQHQQLSSCLVGSGISFDKALKLARKFKINHQESIDAALMGSSSAGHKESTAGRADLDQMRQSLTQLGNSLAFMRLLKSGALNCASKSVDYLPELEDTSSLRLGQLVEEEFCGRKCSNYSCLLDAANNFDACLEDFGENFSPETDYFSIVLRLFSEALNSETTRQDTSKGPSDETNDIKAEQQPPVSGDEVNEVRGHQKGIVKGKGQQFKFFYLLIPSLTINFIDHIINAKERVVSRSSANRVGALICDDGFPMGVAFLLIVLRQTEEFAKLEWFNEVRTKLDSDQADVQRKIGNSKYEESLKQTSSMTLRRLNRLQQEYDGLNYNLKSAMLLFRSSTIQRAQASR